MPVLVGAAAVSQRVDDPEAAHEPIALMIEACRAAADPAALLDRTDLVAVPHGSWTYGNAAGLVAAAIGRPDARTVVADLGVLQTSVIAHATNAIARGDVEVAVVTGGEARWRAHRAAITGAGAPETSDAGAPDHRLVPEGMIISAGEIAAGLVTAVSHYALIENARRHRDQMSLDAHAMRVADRWASFNAVAQRNPQAWHRTPMTADEIRTPGPGNRALAFPYNKWHNSQWNVDQAAALVLCSAATAAACGVPQDRWVFPHAITESNVMVPVSARSGMTTSPGFAAAGAAAYKLAGKGPDQIEHSDLYSCFPAAVECQIEELGLAGREVTVTGGMTFAGGPLNNYVLQALVAMVDILRANPSAAGLVTAVSGMITKQGVSIWGAHPPAAGYRFEDVVPPVPGREVVTHVAGAGTVATYTTFGTQSVVIADRSDGLRAIATSDDPDIAASMRTEEWCGLPVRLHASGGFDPA